MKFDIARANFHYLLKAISNVGWKEKELGDDLRVTTIKRSFLGLSVSGGKLYMTVVGDGVAVRHTVHTDNAVEGGPIFVDAIRLADITKKKSLGDSLTCELTEAGFVVEGKSRFVLTLVNEAGTGYLPFPDTDENLPQMKAGALAVLIKSVKAFVPARKEKRPELSGVHLHTDGWKLVSVATNGQVLGRYAVDCPDGLDVPDGLTIPNDSIPHILDFLDAVGGLFPVSLHVTDGKLMLVADHASLVTTLLDSRYPDYKRLLASRAGGISVDYQQFSNAIDLCLPQASNFVVARSVDGEDGLGLFSWTPDKGLAETFFDADTDGLVGGLEPVAFNPSYMLSMLEREVRIDFGDGMKPIRVWGEFDKEFEGMIMPMRASIP